MRFGKMIKKAKGGAKFRLPEMPENSWVMLGDIQWGGGHPLYQELVLVNGSPAKWETLRLCWRILDSKEWEEVP